MFPSSLSWYILVFLILFTIRDSVAFVNNGNQLNWYHLSGHLRFQVGANSNIAVYKENRKESLALKNQSSSINNYYYQKEEEPSSKNSRAKVEQYKLHQELKKRKKQKKKKYGGIRGGAQWAEEKLMEAVELWQQDSSKIHLTDVAFNIVIMGYAHQAKYDTSAPMRAESLLQKMRELVGINPSQYSYNAVIQAWSNSSRQYKNLRPYYAVIRLMEEMQTLGGYEPDTFTYNLVIECNLQKAKQWLTRMEARNIPADRQTYNLLFKSFSKDGTMADEAEALVEELLSTKNNEHRSNIVAGSDLRPNAVWINCVISALSKSCSPNRGRKADSWFKRMQTLYQLGQSNMRPDAFTYSQLINVHASLKNEKRVEELLEDLEHRFVATGGEPELQPTVVTYTTAMKAYINSPDKALLLLQKMKDSQNIQPNIVTYNTLIKLLASSQSNIENSNRQSNEKMSTAMELFDELKEAGLRPNAATYAELIFGWSASGAFEAGYQAQELLQELESLPFSKQQGVEMTKLYNAVILSWGRSSQADAPRHAEELLSVMERKCDVAALIEREPVSELASDHTCCPNIVTFISVADAYAKACVVDAEERCNILLHKMKHLGIEPTRVLYNSILNALAKSCQSSAIKKAEEIFQLMGDDVDIFTYSTMVDCHTKCGEAYQNDSKNNGRIMGNAIDKADEILDTVEKAYEATGDLRFKPTPVFYSAILQAYAKSASPEGAEKAERLLRNNERLYHSNPDRYDYCKPHAILYNAVIDAIARSGRPDSGQQAELLLQEIELKNDNDSFQVTRRTLNAVLLAYRNDHENGGQKAEYILKRMEELTNAGVYDVMPDVIAWNTAIGAIAKSNDPTAAERAYALFKQMQSSSGEQEEKALRNKPTKSKQATVYPDGITYAYVIEAWLKRNDKEGTAMAQQLLDEFYTLLQEQKKDTSPSRLKPDPVWNVIQAYQKDQNTL